MSLSPTAATASAWALPPFFTLFSILIIFLCALFGAVLPLHLVSLPSTARPPALFRYGNAFAAGFLAAAAFVHLLPAADRTLLQHFPRSPFPFSGLLALLGATAVFALDHVLRHRLSHTHTPDPAGHVHLHLHPHDKPTDSHTPLLPTTTAPPPSSSSSSASPAIAYVLAAALSLHSLIEGLTLGASVQHAAAFLPLLAAILAHKTFAALSLGSSLAAVVEASGHSPSARSAALATAVGFAVLTPLGALLGVAAVTSWLQSQQAVVVSAALNAVSAGIFLYVAFVELLAEEFRCAPTRDPHHPDKEEEGSEDTMQRAVVFMSSAAAMSLLAIWT